jgi:hypothetical protein
MCLTRVHSVLCLFLTPFPPFFHPLLSRLCSVNAFVTAVPFNYIHIWCAVLNPCPIHLACCVALLSCLGSVNPYT